MRDKNEIELKLAYWRGRYYSLEPKRRTTSTRSEKEWHIAATWVTVLEWVLGKRLESATILREPEDNRDWT
jgi:hypothetical protein